MRKMPSYVPAEDVTECAPGEQSRQGAVTTRRLTVMMLLNGLRPGGAEQQFVELASALDQERFRVLVTTLSPSSLLEDELRETPGVEVHAAGRRGRWDPTSLPSLVWLLRREKVDVVQPFATPATAYGLTAAAIARTPVRIAIERCGSRLNMGLGGRFWRFIEDRLARRADAVVPDSEAGASHLVSQGVRSEKVRVIYDGVAPERVRTNLPEREALRGELGVLDESWLIGVEASLTPEEDHGGFLQAASIVRAEVPGTKFLVVGEGPLRAELQRRAAVLGLAGSVIFAGPGTRVAPYIGAMDVAVLSGRGSESTAEFGRQAMGLGRPIVATDTGVNAEIFASGEAGLVVPPDNPIILAHAILEVMRHPDAVERMRARGREIFRERFAMSRMVTAYEELYEDLWRAFENRRAIGAEGPRAGVDSRHSS